MVDPLDQYLRSADPALASTLLSGGGGPTVVVRSGQNAAMGDGASMYSMSMAGGLPTSGTAPRPGSPAGSYASSFTASVATGFTGATGMTGRPPGSPRSRKAPSPTRMDPLSLGYDISEDEQKLLAAIQVLEAAMQSVDRGTPPGGRTTGSPSPLPGDLPIGSAAARAKRSGRSSSRDHWAGSLTKAAVQMGLAPQHWAPDEDDSAPPVEVNTDPRLAEDFAAECKVFYSKASDGRAQRAAMLADGVVLGVCRGMARHLPFGTAQEWGCRALEILAISSDHTHKVAAGGGIKAVVAAMNAHVSNESVQEAGAAALRNLTVNSDNQAKAAACGGIEAVIGSMVAHPSHVGVQEAGCQMLRNLASKSHKDKVVAAGGIESVVAAMNAHVGDAGVQEAACVVLRKLAVTPEYQAQAAEAGAIEAVLQALQVHGYNASVANARGSLRNGGTGGEDDASRQAGGSKPNKRPQKGSAAADGTLAIATTLGSDPRGVPLVPGGIQRDGRRRLAQAPSLRLPSRWPLPPTARENAKQAAEAKQGGGGAGSKSAPQQASDMQLQGCAALRLLIGSEESKLKAMAAGATDVLLAALRGNRNNAEVQEQACAVLAVLTLDSLTEILGAGNFSDALLVCKAMLRTQSDNLPVVEKATAVLVGLIANSEAQVKAAGEAGVVEALMKPLKVHITNADVQEQAGALLQTLSSSRDNVVRMAAAGCVDALMTAMDEHLQNAAIQESGCATLNNLAMVDAADAGAEDFTLPAALPGALPPDRFGENAQPGKSGRQHNGGIRVVVAALQAHADNVQVQLEGCAALRSLCYNADNQVKAAVAGGIETLVATLRAHVDNDTVMEAACGAAAKLTGVPVNKAKALECGVLEAVIAAMARHPRVQGVQRDGCAAIASISVSADAQMRAAAAGGIDVVISALHGHLEEEAVQQTGCLALKHLTSTVENHLLAADKGAIRAVIAALTLHLSNAGVQEGGCGVLKNLTIAPDKKIEASQEGGVEAVLAALREHPNNVRVAEAACGALGLLVADQDNEKKVAVAGGIEAVVAALRAHFSHAAVAEAGCGALGNLAVTPKHQTMVAACGGIDATVAAMRVHVEVADVQLQGCAALRNLAANNVDNQKLVARRWGIEAVVTALLAHPQHVELQVVGCAALRNLSSIKENEVAVAAAGGIEAVVQALRVHGNSAAVQEAGCEALASIVWTQLEIQRWALQAGAREVCKAAISTRFPNHEGVQRTARMALAKIAAARRLSLFGIPAAGTAAAAAGKQRSCLSTKDAEELVAWLGNDMEESAVSDILQLAMSSDGGELSKALLRLPAPTDVTAPVPSYTGGAYLG